MLLFDATHTSHTRAQTGIQQVCRALFAELSAKGDVRAVCHDPYLQAWRELNAAEKNNLSARDEAGSSRGAQWPLSARLGGRLRRFAGHSRQLPTADAVLCPELFSTKIGAQLPALFATVLGPRVAIFHDAIGLKYPELTPPATVARLPAYLRELLAFDGVAAVSEDSAVSLRDYWRWLGLTDTPPVQAIPLGRHAPIIANAANSSAGGIARVLCVGTIEGRKNHGALLEACESLWAAGVKFELELIGLARPDTAGATLARIAALQKAGRPLHYHGVVSRTALQAAYARCAFTVYPSLLEGFGLPVLESIDHGKPCICSSGGALGESATGGGCIALETVDAPSLAAAVRRLLQDPTELAALSVAARARPFRSWSDYAADLTEWMNRVRRRA